MRQTFARPGLMVRPMPRPLAFGASGRTVPALVIEGETIPKVPIDTALGVGLGISGALLVGEGLLSIFLSADQSALSTILRIGRIGIGGGLLIWVASSSV